MALIIPKVFVLQLFSLDRKVKLHFHANGKVTPLMAKPLALAPNPRAE